MDPGPDRVLGLAPAVLEDPDLVGLADPVALGRLAPVAPAVRADPHLVDRVELVPVVPHLVERVDLTDLVAPVAPADPHLVDRLDLVAPVVPRLVDRLDRAVPAVPHLVDLVDLTDPAVREVPVDLDRAARLDLVELGPADLVVPVEVDPAALVVPVDRAALVVPDLMAPVGRVAQVDHRRRLMYSTAPSIAVARNSAVRETRRTASAHPIMVLRHRPRSTGSVGTAGRLLVVLRRTGTGRLLPVAGTVRRLPVVGTRRGTVLAAT